MSNVYVKSNVFPREQGSVWRDKSFLNKINDARLLGKIADQFKKNKPNENIKAFFSESQILIMRSPVTCTFAAGGATYGLVGEKRKLVCRCPYAADEMNRQRCGKAWDDCHELYEAPITVDLGPEPAIVAAKPTPAPPPLPPSPSESEQVESKPPQKPTVIDKPKVNEEPKESSPQEPSPKKTPEPEQQIQKDVLPQFGIVYPEHLSVSCNGYDIKGEKVRDGYEIRVTVEGVFLANINSNGIVLGRHSALKTKDDQSVWGKKEVSFADLPVLKLELAEKSQNLTIQTDLFNLMVCVK